MGFLRPLDLFYLPLTRVESGVLYTIYLGTNLAFQKSPIANVSHFSTLWQVDLNSNDNAQAILDCAAVQVVVSSRLHSVFLIISERGAAFQGMVPTLIMVQVGLGRTLMNKTTEGTTAPQFTTAQRPNSEDGTKFLMHPRTSTSMSIYRQ